MSGGSGENAGAEWRFSPSARKSAPVEDGEDAVRRERLRRRSIPDDARMRVRASAP